MVLVLGNYLRVSRTKIKEGNQGRRGGTETSGGPGDAVINETQE